MTIWKYVIVPGRHHANTNFQATWIRFTMMGTVKDDSGETIYTDEDTIWIFPITSANHHTTRRNPVPLTQRIAQVELFARAERINALVIPIPDLPETPRFAEYVVERIADDLNIPISPEDTLVAVSTPVGKGYASLGYRLGGIEADGDANTPTAWDTVLAASVGDDEALARIAHHTTLDVWRRYDITKMIQRVFTDEVVSGEDGGLTETRHYAKYAEAFELTAARKWLTFRDWVEPGRIVDIGCATGQLLVEAGKESALANSDLIGIETDRWLHAEATHRAEQGFFPNPNTFFYRRNILNGQTFAPRSINTTITAALTHEIYSYGDREADLELLQRIIRLHTAPGGVWINSDVAGPVQSERPVHLTLSTDDGRVLTELLSDVESRPQPEVAAELIGTSTWSRFQQFAHDYPRISGLPWSMEIVSEGVALLSLKDAMEFLLHKDYTDNWASELHESFTYRNWGDWKRILEADGWRILPGSGGYTNEWIATNRFAPVASLADAITGESLPFPDTHILYAATPIIT